MAEFYGSALLVAWNGPSGTVSLSADQRQVTFSPSVQLEDVTSGSEANKTYLTGIKEFTVSYKGLYQTGTAAAGAHLEDKLGLGSIGTLYIQPLGTGLGNRIYTMPVISQGVQQSWGYNSLTEINVTFTGNGSITYGTN